MTALPISSPADIGFDPARLQRTYELLDAWTKSNEVPAAAMCVGRHGQMIAPSFFGRHHPDVPTPIKSDALFLVASLTKPVTVAALMMLVERGELLLEDQVSRYVPRFAQNGKVDVEIRHLMNHTSGLPDMVPSNAQLRAAHQPISAFVDEICTLPLMFPVGSKVSYQSAGTAMLGEVLRVITGSELPEFLRREIFEPLGMHDTSLGWQIEKRERIAAVRITAEQQATDWHWNSPYWLGLGAPWGGMITSPTDFARFCQLMLNDGRLGNVQLLSPASVQAMTTNQLVGLPQLSDTLRRQYPWGLGWRLHWPGRSINFGDLIGPRAYGHWGATGTLCWMDPDTAVFAVLFTTEPQGEQGRYLARASNSIAAAIVADR
jgi:CubicO group peptidase (beta-lactamase class C family)